MATDCVRYLGSAFARNRLRLDFQGDIMILLNNNRLGLIFFVLMVLVDSLALLLEKKGLNEIGHVSLGWSSVMNVATNPYVIGGLILSAIGFALWLVVLSQFKISYIYPFGSVIYVIITVLAYFVLGESISMVRVLGIAVIVCGCILINL